MQPYARKDEFQHAQLLNDKAERSTTSGEPRKKPLHDTQPLARERTPPPAKMVILRPSPEPRLPHPHNHAADPSYLAKLTAELQRALDALLARRPDLETARDYAEYLKQLSHELDARAAQENSPRSGGGGGALRRADERADWLAQSARRVEQGFKYVRDCHRLCAPPTPPATHDVPTAVLGQEQPLGHGDSDSPVVVVERLARVRERLEMLDRVTTVPAPRCFVSLYKRERLGDGHVDDAVLIANAGSRVGEQRADAVKDGKQFRAVYGQCPRAAAAVRYAEAFGRLYGLSPEEACGSLREGPVTDIINEHAEYIMRTEQADDTVELAFAQFIEEVRRWSYQPGVGNIIVPEYHIDQDLERSYWRLRHATDAVVEVKAD